MPQDALTLWLPDAQISAAGAVRDGPEASGPVRVQIEFLDADGSRVGDSVDVEMPAPRPVEVPSGAAGFEWATINPPLHLPAPERARRASFVRASLGAEVLTQVPLAAAAASPTPPVARRTFNPAGDWTITLVSELFGDAETFFETCAELHEFIMGAEPFREIAVGRHLKLEALFWPSPAEGLFKTQVNGRLVHGDNRLVRKFLRAADSSGRMTLVLVNSAVRGGAGGDRERPAWVTNTSNPAERWEAVALHELGHSFGLADEYDDSTQPTPQPGMLEPNVTDRKRADDAPWAHLTTPQNIPHDPTRDAAGVRHPPPDAIGTFEGARYKRTNLYRPTEHCLMRSTRDPFCPVCRALISRTLAGG